MNNSRLMAGWTPVYLGGVIDRLRRSGVPVIFRLGRNLDQFEGSKKMRLWAASACLEPWSRDSDCLIEDCSIIVRERDVALLELAL